MQANKNNMDVRACAFELWLRGPAYSDAVWDAKYTGCYTCLSSWETLPACLRISPRVKYTSIILPMQIMLLSLLPLQSSTKSKGRCQP